VANQQEFSQVNKSGKSQKTQNLFEVDPKIWEICQHRYASNLKIPLSGFNLCKTGLRAQTLLLPSILRSIQGSRSIKIHRRSPEMQHTQPIQLKCLQLFKIALKYPERMELRSEEMIFVKPRARA